MVQVYGLGINKMCHEYVSGLVKCGWFEDVETLRERNGLMIHRQVSKAGIEWMNRVGV